MSYEGKSIMHRALWACALIAIGVYWLLMNHGLVPRLNVNISRDWPAIFIIIGIVILSKAWELARARVRQQSMPADRSQEQRRILDELQRGTISAEDAAEQLKRV